MSEPTGTLDCPICGFDKPHTHDATEIAGRGTWNENQKRLMREQAANRHRLALLKEEFDADPRAYATKYGTINSLESSMLANWLLDRVEQLEAALREARVWVFEDTDDAEMIDLVLENQSLVK